MFVTLVYNYAILNDAHSQTFYIQKYHLEFGLNLFRVFDIKQDSQGIIWFSHLKGISSYDGFELKELLRFEDNPKHPFIRIFIDEKDIKWLLPTASRDSILFYKNGKWESISSFNQHSFLILNYGIDVHYESGNPVLYIGSNDGLYKYKENKWIKCSEGINPKYNDINNLYRYGEKLLLCTSNGMLSYFNDKIDSSEFRFLSGKKVLAAKEGYNRQGQKVLWIIETNAFGYYYKGKYYKIPIDINIPLYSNKGLFPIETEGKNKIYFGGSYIKYSYDYIKNELVNLNMNKGFSSNGCMTIFSDNEGSIWFADTRGVDKISSFKILNYFDANGLLESEVSSIVEFEKGKYLFGHNIGFTIYDRVEFRKIKLSDSFEESTGSKRVTDLAYDGKDKIWYAANKKGIGYITKNGKLFRISDNNDSRIAGVCIFKNEVYYLGAEGLYKIRNRKLVKLFSIEEINSNARKLIAIDDALYMIGLNGITKYKDNRIINIKGKMVHDNRNNVYSLYKTKDNTILVGAASGLYEMYNDSIYKSNKIDIKVAVYSILEDKTGNIWLGTIDGLKKINRYEVIEEYGIKNGLAGDEVNRSALIIDSSYKMWVGTNTGLSCIMLSELVQPKTYPKIMFISAVDSKGKEYDLKEDAEIEYTANTISLNFRGLSFINERLINYRIKLTGFDDDWIYIKQKELGKIRYSNLSPGEYEFFIQAKNENGEWSPIFKTEKIIINSPIFLKWWFILIVFVFLVVMISFFARYLFLKNFNKKLNLEIETRRQSEKALIESESKYRTVIEQSIDGIVIFDFNTLKILEVNNSLIELTGYSSEELKSMPIYKIIKKILPSMNVEEKITERNLEDFSGEMKLRKKDSSEIFIDIRLKLLEYSGNKIIYAIVRDITERKNNEKLMEKYNEELKAMINEKDKLFSIIAHDLRSPFTGLIGYSELLAEGGNNLSEAEKKEFANNLYKLSVNLYELVTKLLHWAQFQSGKMKYLPEKIVLNGFMKELIKNFEGNFKMKKIDISINIDENHFVYADKNMLVILFNNLISNAIKFSNMRGVIIISSELSSGGKKIKISVKDNGIGIPAPQLSSIFQAKSTTLTYGTNQESGTGLGLILCKDIVERNKGKISVESRVGYGEAVNIFV